VPISFDYVIVGAGSAGCILADRLSESGNKSVALIESGGSNKSLWIDMPAGFSKTFYHKKYNYCYHTEKQVNLSNREIYVPRGKGLGGSGAINAMVYVRGHETDFEDWQKAGAKGWSYNDILPYFKKIEAHYLGDTLQHSSTGKIQISKPESEAHPSCETFFQACEELGMPYQQDFNTGRLFGAGFYDANIGNGKRTSSASTYLENARGRKNLTVFTNSQVARINFNKRVAKSVVVLKEGRREEIVANSEIIVSAGAIDTPKLLMLSGLGDAEIARQHNINLVRHMPAIGKNLQDHLCGVFKFRTKIKTLNDDFGSIYKQLLLGVQYIARRRGKLSISVNQAGAFANDSKTNLPYAQLYFSPISYSAATKVGGLVRPDKNSGLMISYSPTKPSSRGYVTLADSKPSTAPVIHPNYLSTEDDVLNVVRSAKLALRVAETSPFSSILKSNSFSRLSDQELLQSFKENGSSIYHHCGTCAIGADESMSVVGANLKVHGIDKLRIVDASVFPTITSANINAPTMMVAEKAAKLIIDERK